LSRQHRTRVRPLFSSSQPIHRSSFPAGCSLHSPRSDRISIGVVSIAMVTLPSIGCRQTPDTVSREEQLRAARDVLCVMNGTGGDTKDRTSSAMSNLTSAPATNASSSLSPGGRLPRRRRAQHGRPGRHSRPPIARNHEPCLQRGGVRCHMGRSQHMGSIKTTSW
jgi:hypothetical protein